MGTRRRFGRHGGVGIGGRPGRGGALCIRRFGWFTLQLFFDVCKENTLHRFGIEGWRLCATALSLGRLSHQWAGYSTQNQGNYEYSAHACLYHLEPNDQKDHNSKFTTNPPKFEDECADGRHGK